MQVLIMWFLMWFLSALIILVLAYFLPITAIIGKSKSTQ